MSDGAFAADQRRNLVELYLKNAATHRRAVQPPIGPRDPHEPVPLSYAQEQVWVHAQMAPDLPLYNEPVTIHYTGVLDVTALERSLDEIVRRHEAWRTVIHAGESGPVPSVVPDVHVRLPITDLRGLAEGGREAEAVRLATRDALVPLRMDRAPLFRARLVRLDAERYRLYLVLSHIIFDGVAIYRVFLPELAALYDAFAAGRPSPLPPLPIQYADYACWQRKALGPDRLAEPLAYWRRQLAGDLPVLDLPADRPRPALQTFRGSMQPFVIDWRLLDALRRLSREAGVTLFQTLLAAFAVLLHRYSGQEDVPIGSVTSGRDVPETLGLLGYFLNTVVLRLNVPASACFRTLLAHARDVTVGALAHDRVPFSRLVSELRPSRAASRHPFFQTLFSLEPPMPAIDSRWQLTQMDVDTGATKYDLYLELDERRDGLLGRYHYSTDLFDASTIARMVAHWETLLRSIAANPDGRVSDLAILPEAERRRVVTEWNGTARPVPQGGVHEWIATQAARTPTRVAVRDGRSRLTYSELDRRSHELAWRLRAAGVDVGARVGLLLDRSPEMIVAILAVLNAWGAYVPLDPAWPDERLAFVRDDAAPAAVVTSASFADRIAGRTGTAIVRIDDPAGGDARAGQRLRDRSTPESLAYVLYTSGSTGRPKGVQVEHRSLANFLHGMAADLALTPDTVFLAVTTLSFDIAALELLGPLIAGARVELASSETVRDPAALARRIDRSRATIMQATPSLWRMLVDAGWRGSDRLTILCGGEALDPDLAAALLRRGRRLWNLYGPTEATVWASRHEVTHTDGRSVPIGRPLANTRLYVVDASMNPAPLGVAGEILIGGMGVARGYLGSPALTRERFVPDPFAADPDARVYRTGDIGRVRADGRLEFLGRRDAQVKLRGHRIELGEIECTLTGHADVVSAAVILRPDADGEPSLAAYVVARRGCRVPFDDLRTFLRRTLPEYMVPRRFIFLDEIPLTPNGKIDRAALLRLKTAPQEARSPFVAPRDRAEARLAALWEQVLKVRPIGIHDDFFSLGGHSLIAVRLVARIEQEFGRRLPLSTLLEAPSVEQLAERLRGEAHGQPSWSSLVPLNPAGARPPIFCVHGHFGEVLFYRPLAHRLGPDQPFYALQSSARNGSPDHRTIEEMAAHYLSEIRSVTPHGPYRLGGYCFGAFVAFEMAHQLRKGGEDVALLVFFTGWEPRPPALRERIRRHVDHARQVGLTQKIAHTGRSLEERVRARIVPAADRLLHGRLAPGSWLAPRIAEANLLARRAYVPPSYAGRVVVIASGPAPPGPLSEAELGTSSLRAGTFTLRTVPGDLDSMMQEPFVDEVAREVRIALADADRITASA